MTSNAIIRHGKKIIIFKNWMTLDLFFFLQFHSYEIDCYRVVNNETIFFMNDDSFFEQKRIEIITSIWGKYE